MGNWMKESEGIEKKIMYLRHKVTDNRVVIARGKAGTGLGGGGPRWGR